MNDSSLPEEVRARVRRYQARLALGTDEIAHSIDDVKEGSRRVLLVDVIHDDPSAALQSLRMVRGRLAHDADVRLLCPEFVGARPRGRWRRVQKNDGTAVVRLMRSVGWTVVAVERFSVEGRDGRWVDLAAGEVVPQAHGGD